MNMSVRSENSFRLLPAARVLLLLAVCVAYANSMENAFHFDDFHTVVDNPAIRSLRHVPAFFTDPTSFSVLPANRTYRPLVSAPLALDYALGHGYVPFWFHLSTLLIFLLLIYLIARICEAVFDQVEASGANAWLGLLAAAWFGLHPAMAETVNYVIQRGDIYCTLGCVAGLYVFVQYPGWRRSGLYLLPFAAALLSKPPAAVFPLLLGTYMALFEAPQTPPEKRLRSVLVGVAPSLAVTGLLLWLQSAMTPKSFLPSILSAAEYRWTQPYVWLRYFGQLWLPLHLNVDTDLAPVSIWSAAGLAGLAFVLALGATIWVSWRRPRLRPVAFGLLWFVLTQLPTSLYPLSELENDHRMFFSFVGLMMAAVWAGWLRLEWLATYRRKAWLQPAALGIVLCALAGYAYGVNVRNAVWRNEESLWHDDVLKSPGNGRGLMIYGLTKLNKGEYNEALMYFERALVFTPNYPTLEINLGVVYGAMADQSASKGDVAATAEYTSKAEANFRRAVALAPADDQPHAYLGRWLNAHGRTDEAIAELTKAVALDPQRLFQREQLIQAYANRGDMADARQAAADTLRMAPDDAAAQQALVQGGGTVSARQASFWINDSLAKYRSGQFAGSIESARKAIALDPNSAEAWNNLGASQGARSEWDAAVASERQALRLNPNLQIAQNNLALYLRQKATPATKSADGLIDDSLRLNQSGQFEASIAAARAALRLEPNSAVAWNNIAADFEGLHRWDEAIDAARHAIAIKPDFQLAKNNLAWSESQKKRGER